MGKKLTIRDLFLRFRKATEDMRDGAPIHVPLTKYKNKTFLDIVIEYYSIDKKEAIKKISENLTTVRYTIRTRTGKKVPGYLLFLPEESRQDNKNNNANAVEDLLKIRI